MRKEAKCEKSHVEVKMKINESCEGKKSCEITWKYK